MERSIRVFMVVIVLFVLAAIMAPDIIGRSDSPRLPTVSQEIASVSNAIDLYYEREGSYPGSLIQVVEDGYLPRSPVDFWGIPYHYSIDQPKIAEEERAFYVWSLGRNNRSGGDGPDQDTGNW